MAFLMQLQDVEAAGRLAPFSAAFRAGEIVHLVGPNGAGKSTLLTRMAGLSEAPARFILTDGGLTSGRRRSWRAVADIYVNTRPRRSPCRCGTTWRCICSSRAIAPV